MSLSPTTNQRIVFVDLLRGWAVLIMIETHVVNALLLPGLRENFSYTFLSFFNGLVAPSFLFCAGFALAIILQKKWDDFLNLKPTLWRYLLRLVFIFVVAYSLHVPIFSLSQLLTINDPQRWEGFFQADILHVISLTLISLTLLAVLIRVQKRFIIASTVFALFFIFLAPIIRELDYSSTAIWLRPYFTLKYKSQFPIFPWSAFLISGLLIGNWILKQIAVTDNQQSINKKLAYFASGIIVVSLLLEFIPITIYPNHSFWNASPEFFFVRFGAVLLIMNLCWYLGKQQAGWFQKAVSLFGVESLLVYTVHLIVVYGHTFEWSFIRMFGKTLGYVNCFLLSIALILGMYALAYGWNRLKKWNMKAANIVEYVTLGGIVLRFLFW